MGLLSKMQEKATQEWAKNLTLEQIEEQERLGCDMSEYRIIYEEQQAEKQRFIDSMDLSKLDKYKKARSMGDPFVEEVAQFNKMSDKNKPKLEEAPLVYGRVVQAHHALFTSNPSNKSGAGIVFLFAFDDAHRYDEAWLAKTAERISEMLEDYRNRPETTAEKIYRMLNLDDKLMFSLTIGSKLEKKRASFLPEDCRELIRTLSNDSSKFCLQLGEALSEGADAWCATYSLWDQSKLPMAQIPHNRIIPLLITERKEGYGGLGDAAQLIPPAYFTK